MAASEAALVLKECAQSALKPHGLFLPQNALNKLGVGAHEILLPDGLNSMRLVDANQIVTNVLAEMRTTAKTLPAHPEHGSVLVAAAPTESGGRRILFGNQYHVLVDALSAIHAKIGAAGWGGLSGVQVLHETGAPVIRNGEMRLRLVQSEKFSSQSYAQFVKALRATLDQWGLNHTNVPDSRPPGKSELRFTVSLDPLLWKHQ